MKSMIDFYRSRYGELVKGGEYASSINGPCPFCDGGRDRFIIWADKADNLGKTCTENGIKGVFWCRQCGKGGDSIEYLMSAEGLSFEEACEELGVAKRSVDAIRPHAEKKLEKPAFAGRKTEETKDLWRQHAEKMADAAAKDIKGCKSAMAYLAARGIGPWSIERYQLGFLSGENGKDCRFRPRGSFGLEPKIIGGKSRKLWIPRGITIPSRDDDGSISMFRIRRPNGDLKVRYERDAEGNEKEVKDEKYWELTGGSKASYHLRPEGVRAITVYAVVEAELDAILLHAVSGESIGAVALRNASNKPDEKTHQALMQADIILLCLDS
ncbi:MAG: CHC2 zinc finger domain-containing protein, partial [Mailhella sp.]